MASLFHTLNISRQDLLSRMLEMDVTSSNLANVNTAGYKAVRSNFQEMLDAQYKEGIQLSATQLMPMQGSLRTTENSLDWAIQGEGFFSVTLPDGSTGYTRDGQFMLDAENNLVTSSGYALVWDGAIEAGMTEISVNAEGVVSARSADGEVTEVGSVQLTRFANATGLIQTGENILLESDDSGAAQTGAPGAENFGTLSSYHVENSNIDIALEMTRLMTLQRAITMSVRAFQQTDTMIAGAINLRKA